MKMSQLISIAALLATVAAAPAQMPRQSLTTASAGAQEQVTVITSELLTYDYKQKYALFEQNVTVVDPRIKIMSDKMTVRFDASNKVTQIVCEGHVYITQEDKTAKADVSTYDVLSGDIVLTGNPVVKSGQDTVTGEKIVFNRDRETVRVFGKPKMVIVPGKGGADVFNLKSGGTKGGGKPK